MFRKIINLYYTDSQHGEIVKECEEGFQNALSQARELFEKYGTVTVKLEKYLDNGIGLHFQNEAFIGTVTSLGEPSINDYYNAYDLIF